MRNDSFFSKDELRQAGELLRQGGVSEVIFSEGTYQVEVIDPAFQKSFWPFLQIDDQGFIQDCFCNCEPFEQKKTCQHLAAAYLRLFNESPDPLHVRFRKSLWNQICWINFRRAGHSTDNFKQQSEAAYHLISPSGKRFFSLHAKNIHAQQKIQEIFFQRKEETEETSLKFSNLPFEELELWKEGRPSENLRYELSFWSDLAKWLMVMQDNGADPRVSFDTTTSLPKFLSMDFPEVYLSGYVTPSDWPTVIPALKTTKSDLPVYDFPYFSVNCLTYDEIRQSFFIDITNIDVPRKIANKVSLGDWDFVPKTGFIARRSDAIFHDKVITSEKIAYLLDKHQNFVKKYLENTKIHRGKFPVGYALKFIPGTGLSIEAYLFDEGDLTSKPAAFFGHWAYLPGKGFYELEGVEFNCSHQIIPLSALSRFIDTHQNWLNQFEGFTIHLATIQAYELEYRMTDQGLIFTQKQDREIAEDFIDLGKWIYIPQKGFYPKVRDQFARIRDGENIAKEHIASFIKDNREELEHVQGFFYTGKALKQVGLRIFLNARSMIVIQPEYILEESFRSLQFALFEPFIYLPGLGFIEIPEAKRLPQAYRDPVTIHKADEPFFLRNELEALQPWMITIDRRLLSPGVMNLRLIDLHLHDHQWVVSLIYETDLGQVPLQMIFDAYHAGQHYLISEAGLIWLNKERFRWLESVKSPSFTGKESIVLSTLNWFKLNAIETIYPPQNDQEAYERWILFQKNFLIFSADEDLCLKGLKSNLRSYQKIGVEWLWFLHRYGLSGLLCDDMGLGKTHQAMALMIAIKNQMPKSRKKFLVICPTSVIYHWEGLLQSFLPKMRVLRYHGPARSLGRFKLKYDLLLTSYGVMRSDLEKLSSINFALIILDEMQIAKNRHSRTHKAIKSLSGMMLLGLSGTPIENRLHELKALFDLILPGYFPSEAAFQKEFVQPIEKEKNVEKQNLLSRMIRPFVLRRKKEEVLTELPDKMEEIAYCDLSEEQQRVYKHYYERNRSALYESLEKDSAIHLHVFSLFNTLKLICNHPALLSNKANYTKHESGKWELFVELLDECRSSGQKLVVFSQYLGMLDIIEQYLHEQEIIFASLRGKTKERGEQIKKFQEDPACEVFVGSLKAAGVGIDLTAGSVVIHYDRWWNPAKEDQATDRVHRMGQQRGVQVFKLVTKHTIEEHIHHLIESKKGLIEGVIGYDETEEIKRLNREEIIYLLRKIDEDVSSL